MSLDINQKFEFIAEAFRRQTGMTAPGKDQSLKDDGTPYEDRYVAYRQWREDNALIIHAFCLAAESIFEDGIWD